MAGGKDNLRVPTSEEARINGRKGGIRSGKKRRQNIMFKQVAEEGITLEEAQEMIENLKERSKGSSNDLLVLLGILGQKPADKQELSVKEIPKVQVKRYGRD